MKYKRQNQIINIVKSRPVHTHDELIDLLRAEGHSVTQATVSRDIKELGLIKIQSGDGSQIYSMPEPAAENVARMELVADSVRQVVSALHTVVINTYPGMASAVFSPAGIRPVRFLGPSRKNVKSFPARTVTLFTGSSALSKSSA